MISKTIGFRGYTTFSDTPIWLYGVPFFSQRIGDVCVEPSSDQAAKAAVLVEFYLHVDKILS